MKNTFEYSSQTDVLLNILDTAEERISKLEDICTEISKTEGGGKKKKRRKDWERKQSGVSKNDQTTTKYIANA